MQAVPREIRIFLLVTLALAFIAVPVTVIVTAASRGRETTLSRPGSLSVVDGGTGTAGGETAPGAGSAVRIDPDRLMIPDERETAIGAGWVPSRSPAGSWTAKDIAPYWTDPVELGIEILSRRNRDLIRSVLEGQP